MQDHTVLMLTQWRLPPPLTGTVKLSLFMHAHSSPLSLAARLHQCRTNRSHYINNGWTSSTDILMLDSHPPTNYVIHSFSFDVQSLIILLTFLPLTEFLLIYKIMFLESGMWSHHC